MDGWNYRFFVVVFFFISSHTDLWEHSIARIGPRWLCDFRGHGRIHHPHCQPIQWIPNTKSRVLHRAQALVSIHTSCVYYICKLWLIYGANLITGKTSTRPPQATSTSCWTTTRWTKRTPILKRTIDKCLIAMLPIYHWIGSFCTMEVYCHQDRWLISHPDAYTHPHRSTQPPT